MRLRSLRRSPDEWNATPPWLRIPVAYEAIRVAPPRYESGHHAQFTSSANSEKIREEIVTASSISTLKKRKNGNPKHQTLLQAKRKSGIRNPKHSFNFSMYRRQNDAR
ncbi:hypothetical protein F511_36910 [Dorcoceras hygrometricum]|uniref:Uncharacterized protein n=1 Tax=Dorcoceras hygrometricum TaxID=472368 RepID=A0A2Z7CLQ0_9LAMI|nr:hypothetical protein F511_36910 [Dorcoceras hygrometricum]